MPFASPGFGQESIHSAQFALLSVMTHVHHRLVLVFQAGSSLVVLQGVFHSKDETGNFKLELKYHISAQCCLLFLWGQRRLLCVRHSG